MKNSLFAAVALLAFELSSSTAAPIALTSSDALGVSSFNTGLNWAGGQAPTAGNAYLTSTFRLRTPADANPYTFAGDSLEVQSGGGEVRHKTGATVTINNLILDDGAFVNITQPVGNAPTGAIGGNILLNGTVNFVAGLSTDANRSDHVLAIVGPMTGSGGITTTGSFGSIILSGSNSYSGLTRVGGGILLMNGVLANSAVVVTNGVLSGNGIIKGPVTNSSAGTLRPGLGGTDTSTLTISNTLILSGATIMSLNRTNAQNSTRIAGITTLTQGGSLFVSNAGPALVGGDVFKLFDAASYNGTFSAPNLPALTTGLVWSNSLSVNGTITVFATNTIPIVTNLPASPVLATSATLNGRVVSPGLSSSSITIYYGTSDGGTNPVAWSNSISLGPTNGNFSAVAPSLNTNTTYFFTAFAANAASNVWARPSASFTTLASNPTVTRVPVLTFHYDNSRQGANTNETLLTQSNVNTNTFGKLFSYAVDGYVYTQPLIMTNLTIPGKGVHDVVFIATEHASLYAFDANDNSGPNGGLLWKTNLGISALSANGEFGTRYCGNCYPDIVPEVGATGTPVIDPATGTIYVNIFTREATLVDTNYVHRIHAIDVLTGNERPYSPVVVAGAYPGNGVDSVGGMVTFKAELANQRPALGLANGMLFVAYAGYADTDPYHGWLFGYNATNLALSTNYIFNTTPNATIAAFGVNAAEGGIWQGGGGLCIDSSNNLYFETGNGSFSAHTNGGDYGDTFMKISTTNGFSVADYFTPFDQQNLADIDLDLGSCGPLLLPDSVGSATHPHLLVGMGKSGKVYLIDRDIMTVGNVHYQTGSDNKIVQSFAAVGQSWSPPAFWNRFIYCQPSSGAMKSFTIANGSINTTANATAPASVGQYNGGPTVSANGTNSGIVWLINGNSGNTGAAGTLYALNATNISQLLWSSAQLSSRDSMGPGIKMTRPTVAGGKVYVPGQYTLSVYGVQVFLDTPVISPAGGAFTNLVNVSISDASVGVSIYYTLDGTTPNSSSILYTGPFQLTSNAVVKAIAVQPGSVNSAVAAASFVNTAAPGSGSGLYAEYFANHSSVNPFTGSPTLVQTNSIINFNWGMVGPDPLVGSTNFTVRWTGSVKPQFTEPHTFYTSADDGVRVYINGQLLIDDWTDKSVATTRSNTIAMVAQQLYSIEVDYYQKNSNSSVSLSWSSPSLPFSLVPQAQLYSYTNPPPAVVLMAPANGAAYTATASVTMTADADAQYNPINSVNFYANGNFLGSATDVPYTITVTGFGAGSYSLTAVAVDGSGLSSTSAPVVVNVSSGSGQPYGLTNRNIVPAFYNMPTTFAGSLPPLLSQTGVFSNTPAMTPATGLIPYSPNTPLWSDGALKSRYLGVPYNGVALTTDEQIAFTTNGSWTFPAGTVFVKTFELNTDTTNSDVRHRLETRLLVRDINGTVYGVTYKWRADNSDADLLASSLLEDIIITNATGLSTQTWYYPSPSDCLQCHTPVANYVLGVNTRQLNGDQTYAATGVTDNQLRTLNRLGMFNPAFNETNISTFRKLSSLTNLSASFEERARSYLDANCVQCHQPGGVGITFDARYDMPLASQHITNYPASVSLGLDNARIIASKDRWRSVIWQRMISTDNAIKMPPLARNLVDSNAVDVMVGWIDSLPGTTALAPPVISPDGGTFAPSVSISLLPPDGTVSVRYTLDGSLPSDSSTLYTDPILLLSNATVRASSFKTNFVNSIAAAATFVVRPPIVLTSGSFSNDIFLIGVSGVQGNNYVLLGSTNLIDWTPLSTNPAPTNVFNVYDPEATNFPTRFYLLRQE